ncbi:MAG: 4-hydroxy-tetrahydrodipicolinate synthase [Alphaproteobacteria bacterium]|nr:4-hydroxy-tetrahydrodipicolinate synthase [Alphaproteobacteria bacterium]
MTTTDTPSPRFDGVWLPLVTPFRDGRLDEASFLRLLRHFLEVPVAGFILAATTGEGLTLDDDEIERLTTLAAREVAGRVPVLLGLAGSDTRAMVRRLAATRSWPLHGYLISCPSYSRPSQEGLFRHFAQLAETTERPVLLYNIPYRTSVNLLNETLFGLVEAHPNICGIKDCGIDPQQSVDLLRFRPKGFSVLTGEDIQFHGALSNGADGAIAVSAQADSAAFLRVREDLLAGDRVAALARWRELIDLVRLLFAEPSPAPIKHWLWRRGLIASPELRLPMTGVTPALAGKLDRLLQARGVKAVAA